ncbi:putative gp13 [Mycobacterium xenopi 3993]|nr:putative gp13 [Mycobacterium xenopi 3993]
MPAILVWRQHPTEIEADLADRGHDILDWHRGIMSSRRLLVLLRHAPENGPYKTALREGKWPEFMQILAEIHKELALYRASHYVGSENEYTPKVFIDPVERRALADQQAEEEAASENFQNDLAAQMGWE